MTCESFSLTSVRATWFLSAAVSSRAVNGAGRAPDENAGAWVDERVTRRVNILSLTARSIFYAPAAAACNIHAPSASVAASMGGRATRAWFVGKAARSRDKRRPTPRVDELCETNGRANMFDGCSLAKIWSRCVLTFHRRLDTKLKTPWTPTLLHRVTSCLPRCWVCTFSATCLRVSLPTSLPAAWCAAPDGTHWTSTTCGA